jgi:hypothetical protein
MDEKAERTCAALTVLFSKPINNAKPYRRYALTFENGEPVFTLNEIYRWLHKTQSGVAICSLY